MDDLTRRIAELESAQEEQEKLTGRLTAQVRTATESMQKILQHLVDLQEACSEVGEKQQELENEVSAVRFQIRQLSLRIDRAEEAADDLDACTGRLLRETGTLSDDMDALYADMNLLMRETRRRWKMTREQLAILLDAEDSELPDEWYEEEEDDTE